MRELSWTILTHAQTAAALTHQGQALCGHVTVRGAVLADCQAQVQVEVRSLTTATTEITTALKTLVLILAGANLFHLVKMMVK